MQFQPSQLWFHPQCCLESALRKHVAPGLLEHQAYLTLQAVTSNIDDFLRSDLRLFISGAAHHHSHLETADLDSPLPPLELELS